MNDLYVHYNLLEVSGHNLLTFGTSYIRLIYVLFPGRKFTKLRRKHPCEGSVFHKFYKTSK